MTLVEVSIWAAMSGVLITLWVFSTLEVLTQRSLSALRGWGFITLTGGASMLMTGLPEVLFPGLGHWNLKVVKASMGPLSGSLALFYLGIWSGSRTEDRLVVRISHMGSLFLVLAAVALAAWALLGATPTRLLTVALAVCILGVVMATLVAARSMSLGDPLGRWMVLACLSLAVMVSGLYQHGLGHSMSDAFKVLTVVGTLGYFLLSIWLTLERNRQTRRLLRQASGLVESTDMVGLPRGLRLLQLVEDAIWRSQRMHRPCLVAAIAIPNLHPSDDGQTPTDHARVMATLAARTRRIVGFRNVLGIYNERCFLLAVSAMQDPRRSELLADQILTYLGMRVGPEPNEFEPELGVGVIEIEAVPRDTPLYAILRRAEQLALEASTQPQRVLRERLNLEAERPIRALPSDFAALS